MKRCSAAKSGHLGLFSLILLAILVPTAVACGRIAKPSGWAPPAMNGSVVLVAHRDKLFALDPQTLDEKWHFPGPDDKNVKPSALYGSIAGSGTSLFVPGYSGKVYTVTSDTGKAGEPIFSGTKAIIGGVTSANGILYFGSSDRNLYAIDASNGQQRWKFPTGNEIWSTPAVAGDTVYATSLDGKLYAVDVASGTQRWSYSTAAGVASPPVVDEAAGLVYVAGFDSRLRAIDMNGTHAQTWQVEADNWFWTKPLLANGVVYAGALDSKVYAANVGTGESPWARPFNAKSPVHAAPIIANGKLIVVDRGGHVFSLTLEDGTLAPAIDLALGEDVLADPLVLPDGKVLIVTTGGSVFKIDPATMTIVDQRKL